MDKSKWYVYSSLAVNAVLGTVLIFLFVFDHSKKEKEDKNDLNPIEEIRPTQLEKNIMVLEQSSTGLDKFVDAHQDVKIRLSHDSNLDLVKHLSPEFENSKFKTYLEKLSGLRVFILVDFKESIEYKDLDRLRNAGITTIKPDPEYFNRRLGLFYGKYVHLKYLRGYSRIASVYLIKRFTGEGNYTLDFTPVEDKDKLDISFHLPYTKPGRRLLQRTVSLGGIRSDTLHSEKMENEVLHLNVDVRKGKRITLYTKVKYLVDVESLLAHHIRVVGEMTVGEYLAEMKSHPDYNTFTSTSEKIVFSDYIDEIASKIRPEHTLNQVWGMITKALDEDIKYDYGKRYEFFSGRKVYEDIKDMYMTAAQLGETKVGACPERSSLEAAILRRVGIASRTATRLYHIYTEIILPEIGWVTTSGNIKEIPLCESMDEKQSYFISWAPSNPIKLKWQGGMYPAILY